MMVRRSSAFAALVALTALIATPGGVSSCAWASQAPHGCCAEPAAQTKIAGESCCGEELDPAPSASTTPAKCDCLHAPGSPAAVGVGTPTTHAPEDSAQQMRIGTPPRAEDTILVQNSLDHVPRGDGTTPPLFLLDCAFLT